jgi:hypothetical protein
MSPDEISTTNERTSGAPCIVGGTRTPIYGSTHMPSSEQDAHMTPGETSPDMAKDVKRGALHHLEASHTASEQKVYAAMFRHERDRHWGFKELSRLTGIRSDITIRKAIHGLLDKLSIEILEYKHGHPLGPRYRVYTPKEIASRRRQAGISIDPQSKRPRTPPETQAVTPTYTPQATPISPPAAARRDAAGGIIANPLTPAYSDESPASNRGPFGGDDDLFAVMASLLPDESPREIERAIRDLHTILAAFAERAAERAPTPPQHAAFFVTCVRSALAAREAVDRIRTARPAAPPPLQPEPRPEANIRELLKAVAYEIRHAAQNDPEYTEVDLRRDLRSWCEEQAIKADATLLDNAISETAPKIP